METNIPKAERQLHDLVQSSSGSAGFTEPAAELCRLRGHVRSGRAGPADGDATAAGPGPVGGQRVA